MFGATDVAQVEAVAETLRGLLTDLDPPSVPLPEAPGLWSAFDRVGRFAAAAKTLLAGRVDASGAWREAGHADAASHLASLAGGSIRDARRQLTTSRRLDRCHRTAAALRAGSVSATQADHIADAATVSPAAEADLLWLAQSQVSLKELGDACGRAKAAGDPDPDATYDRIRGERRLRQRHDAEGAWCLSGRGTTDAGALVNRALEEIIDELFSQARDNHETITRDQLAFDALHEMARRSLHDQADEPQQPRRRRNRAMRYLGLIRVDIEALQRGQVDDDELCEITGAGPIPVARARELLGDAVLKLVITNGVDVLSVTHLGRAPTVAQRTALLWQNPTCSVTGCPRTWVEWDHRIDWARTHHTRLDELDGLCKHHHGLKTGLGWALVRGKGKRPMVPPQDPRHPAHHSNTSGPPVGGHSESAETLLHNSIAAA